MKKPELIFSALLVPLDLAMLVAAGFLAYILRFSAWFNEFSLATAVFPLRDYLPFVLAAALFWLVIFAALGLYRLRVNRSVVEEFFLVILGAMAGFAGIAVAIFFSREFFQSRLVIVMAAGFAPLLVGAGRVALKKFQQFLVGRYGIGAHRVLIVGHNRGGRARALINELTKTRRFGYEVVAVESNIDLSKVETIIKKRRLDDVFVTDLQYAPDELLALAALCHQKGIGFHFTAGVFDTLRTRHQTLATIPLVEVLNTPLDGWGRIAKRGLDLIGGLIGLPVVGLAYLIIGAAIKLDSRGPVIISLTRLGQNGRPFKLYKFRSMIAVDLDGSATSLKTELLSQNERSGGPLFKLKNDPRVTRVGRVLRRFRLDEFPQLLNLFRGEMSLVGPRPHEPQEVAQYGFFEKRLLSIRPGITGLAQISGSSDLPFDQEVKLDTYYIENWSLLQDLKILIRTAVILLVDRSAV